MGPAKVVIIMSDDPSPRGAHVFPLQCRLWHTHLVSKLRDPVLVQQLPTTVVPLPAEASSAGSKEAGAAAAPAASEETPGQQNENAAPNGMVPLGTPDASALTPDTLARTWRSLPEEVKMELWQGWIDPQRMSPNGTLREPDPSRSLTFGRWFDFRSFSRGLYSREDDEDISVVCITTTTTEKWLSVDGIVVWEKKSRSYYSGSCSVM